MADDESSDEVERELNLGGYAGERDENEARHGHGKAFHPNGDTYEGQYVQGKRQGKGFYEFENGATYKGEYLEGKRHGLGTMHYPDGSVYKGSWERSMKHGKGIYYYRKGDIYDGSWMDDRKHGPGILTIGADNTTIKGNWINGLLQGSVAINYNSYSFRGNYLDGRPEGEGKYRFESLGIEQIGSYIAKKEGRISDFSIDAVDSYMDKRPIWKSRGIKLIDDMFASESNSSIEQSN